MDQRLFMYFTYKHRKIVEVRDTFSVRGCCALPQRASRKSLSSQHNSVQRREHVRLFSTCTLYICTSIILIGECPPPPHPPLPENKKNQSCSELSETNFGIGFASIREKFFSILENSAVILKDFEIFRVRTSSLHRPVFSQMQTVKYSSALWNGLNETS